MCPDKQILSIYLDEELPSPWKEKLETHLESCSACAQEHENLKQLRQIFKNDTVRQDCGLSASKVWQKLECRQKTWQNITVNRIKRGASGSVSGTGIWQRKLSIPLPAAAAAVIIITLITVIGLHGAQINSNNGISNAREASFQAAQTSAGTGFAIAAENEIPGNIPAVDINDVLKYLSSDGADIIILKLPESQSFYRTGEPGIIKAADYRR